MLGTYKVDGSERKGGAFCSTGNSRFTGVVLSRRRFMHGSHIAKGG